MVGEGQQTAGYALPANTVYGYSGTDAVTLAAGNGSPTNKSGYIKALQHHACLAGSDSISWADGHSPKHALALPEPQTRPGTAAALNTPWQ